MENNSMKVTGKLAFTDVTNADLCSILPAIQLLDCEYDLLVTGKGATRNGEIFDFSERHFPLLENKVTARKQFFNIAINGCIESIRPFNDRFDSLVVDVRTRIIVPCSVAE
jgi:hypothetical protein